MFYSIIWLSKFSSSSSAISRELANLRSEIRHMASRSSKEKERMLREKEDAENSRHHERKKQKITQERLKEIANAAEEIKPRTEIY